MHPWLSALAGGALIGLSASVLLLGINRVAGISGILSGALSGQMDRRWRLAFIGGLVVGGLIMVTLAPGLFVVRLDRSFGALALAGLLVGFGSRLGGGCTSGHGVCGNARLSMRSIVATLTFIATGAVTVYVVQHLMGGRA